MTDFSKEIDAFQKYGTYEYKFDEGGNLVFKKSPTHFTEQYLSIPLIDYVYDEEKINSFYNLEFLEFSPNTEIEPGVLSSSNKIEVLNLEMENQELKNRLTLLTERADGNITESERLAIKQVIIDLRIALKQGVAERDFSPTFPYLPITKL